MNNEYYTIQSSVDEYIKLAAEVNSKAIIEKFKQVVPLNAEVLELGSGPGTDWELLNEVYETTGSDFSEVFLAHLKAKYPDGNFIQLNAISLAIEQQFDAIYSNKVLQHLTVKELEASIQRQAALLKKEGIVCHTVWKGKGNEQFKGMSVQYYQKEDLEQLFQPYFKVLNLECYTEFEEEDSLCIIAQKL